MDQLILVSSAILKKITDRIIYLLYLSGQIYRCDVPDQSIKSTDQRNDGREFTQKTGELNHKI